MTACKRCGHVDMGHNAADREHSERCKPEPREVQLAVLRANVRRAHEALERWYWCDHVDIVAECEENLYEAQMALYNAEEVE